MSLCRTAAGIPPYFIYSSSNFAIFSILNGIAFRSVILILLNNKNSVNERGIMFILILLPDNRVENSELNNFDDEPVIRNFTPFSLNPLTNRSHPSISCASSSTISILSLFLTRFEYALYISNNKL